MVRVPTNIERYSVRIGPSACDPRKMTVFIFVYVPEVERGDCPSDTDLLHRCDRASREWRVFVIEGWHGEDYLVLFDKADRVGVSRRYDLNLYLEGFQAVGLLGWDNFIVERDTGGLTPSGFEC